MDEAYVNEVLRLRSSHEARAIKAYISATTQQVLGAADVFASSGTIFVETDILSRTVRDVYTDAFTSFARFTYNHLTARKAEMDEETRKRVMVILINFFFANLQLLVQQMSRTTRVDIIAIVQKGVQGGKNNAEIARDIRKAAPNLARNRAPVRAGTSVVAASNMGSKAAAGAAGSTSKIWYTTLDERTRRGERGFDHASAHMQEVPISAPFSVSGEMLDFPGDTSLGASVGNVISCRCVPVFKIQQQPS